MPRKEWTEAEKKAWGAKMKALRDAKVQTIERPSKKPNVPRPVEMSVWRWNQHLKDHGFEVEE